MTLEAVGLAKSLTRDDYITGRIDADELDRRLGVILGLDGVDLQRRVLSTASGFIDITSFSDARPTLIPTEWEWPNGV